MTLTEIKMMEAFVAVACFTAIGFMIGVGI